MPWRDLCTTLRYGARKFSPMRSCVVRATPALRRLPFGQIWTACRRRHDHAEALAGYNLCGAQNRRSLPRLRAVDVRVFAVQLASRKPAVGVNDVLIAIPDSTRLYVVAVVVTLFGSAGWYIRRPE